MEPVTAPKSLRSLCNSKCDKMDYQSLVEHCDDLFPKLNVTDQQATKIERQTRNQPKCSAWYAARVGRVTASQLHAVCQTSVDKPALSTISNVCYPERSQKKQTSVPATVGETCMRTLPDNSTLTCCRRNMCIFKWKSVDLL